MRLDETALAALDKELSLAFQRVRSQAAEMLDNVQLYRDLYAGTLKEKPLSWSANINIPMVEYLLKTSSRKLSQKLFASDPIFAVESEEPESVDAAPGMERLVQKWMERMRFASTGSVAISEAMLTGQCWLKNGVKKTDSALPVETGQPMTIDELDIEPTGDYVTTEDMMLIPFTAPSFERAKGAFSKVILTWDDILAESGSLYEDAVNRLKAGWARGAGISPTHEQQGISEWIPDGLWQAEFVCYEGWYKWVKPGDKREKRWLLLVYYPVDEGQAIVLRCTEYDTVYRDLMFSLIVNDPQPNSMWGRSMVEGLKGLQMWTNATFSQCTDAITLALFPPTAVPQGSELLRRNLKRGPNQLWPVSSPADVQVLHGSPTSIAAVGAGFSQMALVREYGERLTSTTDITSGKTNEDRRTATEIGAVVESGNELQNFVVSVLELGSKAGDGFSGFAQKLVGVLDRFMPAEPVRFPVQKKGKPDWQTVTPDWYKGKYKFTIHGAQQTWDPRVRMERAVTTLKMFQQCPFGAVSPIDKQDVVIEKIQRLWNAYRDLFTGLGNRDAEVWIGSKPETIEEALSILALTNPGMAQQILSTILPQPALGAQSGTPGQLSGQMAALQPVPASAPGAEPGGQTQGGFGGGGGLPQPVGASGMGQVMQ